MLTQCPLDGTLSEQYWSDSKRTTGLCGIKSDWKGDSGSLSGILILCQTKELIPSL